MQVFRAEVSQVQVDGVPTRGRDRRALALLVPDRLREPVARSELHVLVLRFADRRLGSQPVVREVPVPVLVEQHAALTAASLGDQDARARQARRVVLDELHVP